MAHGRSSTRLTRRSVGWSSSRTTLISRRSGCRRYQRTARSDPGARWHRPRTDGEVTVTVSANVGSVLEADAALQAGASGIGLVRTELLFLGRRTPPSTAEQRNVYARIRERMGARPVVFRTLDVGGDKPAAWQTDRPEANPALGVRGVRLGLARPDLLDDQLRALRRRGRRGRGPDHAADGRHGRGGPRRAGPAGRDRRVRRSRRRPPSCSAS